MLSLPAYDMAVRLNSAAMFAPAKYAAWGAAIVFVAPHNAQGGVRPMRGCDGDVGRPREESDYSRDFRPALRDD